jgi:hypothetical protein
VTASWIASSDPASPLAVSAASLAQATTQRDDAHRRPGMRRIGNGDPLELGHGRTVPAQRLANPAA